jgi:hypothetical protein
MLDKSNIENVSPCNSPTDVNCRGEQPLPKVTSNPDEKIRRFLVYWTAFALTLILIIFAVTRDGIILTSSTVFAVAITAIFKHYFRREGK